MINPHPSQLRVMQQLTQDGIHIQIINNTQYRNLRNNPNNQSNWERSSDPSTDRLSGESCGNVFIHAGNLTDVQKALNTHIGMLQNDPYHDKNALQMAQELQKVIGQPPRG